MNYSAALTSDLMGDDYEDFDEEDGQKREQEEDYDFM
jgi:hypothetical protein